MNNYVVTDTELTYEANKIRGKLGNSDPITFVSGKGFGDAIDSISTGGGGFDYDLKEVTVSNNTPTVDRAFDNFVFIAQCQKTSIPAVADRGRLKAYFLMFAYVNGNFIPTAGNKGFAVSTPSAASESLSGVVTGMSSTSIGTTSITFSTYTSQNMQAGKWNVLQIELPSTSPIYSFYDL